MSESKAIADSNFSTGAVRSADVAHLDFASMPLLGLLAVLRVAGGGGTKYGRFNYMQGMPLHETINHMAVHLIRFCLGDRSEPHLAKVAWGAMVAEQTAVLNPELAEPHMLGPGATLTAAMIAELERGKPERDARRQAGEFEHLFNWTLGDMPEVQAIIAQRIQPKIHEVYGAPTRSEPCLGYPTPKDNEIWVDYIEDRVRAYYRIKDDGPAVVIRDVSDEDKAAIKKAILESPPSHIFVDPSGSHPLDHAYRTLDIKGRGEVQVDDDGFLVIPPDPKITPASEGGDHMGGCPPLP